MQWWNCPGEWTGCLRCCRSGRARGWDGPTTLIKPVSRRPVGAQNFEPVRTAKQRTVLFGSHLHYNKPIFPRKIFSLIPLPLQNIMVGINCRYNLSISLLKGGKYVLSLQRKHSDAGSGVFELHYRLVLLRLKIETLDHILEVKSRCV